MKPYREPAEPGDVERAPINEKLGLTTNEAIRRYLASEDFQKLVERKMAEAAEPVLVDALAERISAIEFRVGAIVEAEFDRVVAEAARRRLADAIEEVRAAFVRKAGGGT